MRIGPKMAIPVVALLLAGCSSDGPGDSSAKPSTETITQKVSPDTPAEAVTVKLRKGEAVRVRVQSSEQVDLDGLFGATPATIEAMANSGYDDDAIAPQLREVDAKVDVDERFSAAPAEPVWFHSTNADAWDEDLGGSKYEVRFGYVAPVSGSYSIIGLADDDTELTYSIERKFIASEAARFGSGDGDQSSYSVTANPEQITTDFPGYEAFLGPYTGAAVTLAGS